MDKETRTASITELATLHAAAMSDENTRNALLRGIYVGLSMGITYLSQCAETMEKTPDMESEGKVIDAVCRGLSKAADIPIDAAAAAIVPPDPVPYITIPKPTKVS